MISGRLRESRGKRITKYNLHDHKSTLNVALLHSSFNPPQIRCHNYILSSSQDEAEFRGKEATLCCWMSHRPQLAKWIDSEMEWNDENNTKKDELGKWRTPRKTKTGYESYIQEIRNRWNIIFLKWRSCEIDLKNKIIMIIIIINGMLRIFNI